MGATINNLLKDFFLDAILKVLYFPVWWYGRGLKDFFFFCLKRIRNGWQALALSIFFINFFKPMYGQRDILAYILSVNTHFWQVLFRLALMFFWSLFWLLALILWLVSPVAALIQLII